MISRDEVTSNSEQWADTSYLRSDGKEEYRERKQFGNRHAIFEPNALWGDIHYDQYNATDFPKETTQHFSNYVEEKTGIPQNVVTGAIVGIVAGLSLYAGYKTAKWIGQKL